MGIGGGGEDVFVAKIINAFYLKLIYAPLVSFLHNAKILVSF